MLVRGERPWGGEQEYDGEQPPLHLEPGVGAGIEELADDGVAGAHESGGDDEPGDPAANAAGGAINEAAQADKSRHSVSSRPIPCQALRGHHLRVSHWRSRIAEGAP